MKKEILYGIIGLVIGVFITVFVTSNAVNNNNTSMMQMMGVRGNQNMMSRSNTLDAHFIEQMIPHHEDAITMANLAQTKAQHPEVKELANNIIDSQGKEITQMKDWYKTWFGKDVPTDSQVMNQHGMIGNNSSTHMGMMGDASDMTDLEKSTDFDRAFVEEMIPHHQMAVMMATMLRNGTEKPEMKKLADDIIAAQTTEIDQMRQWLKSWQ